MARICEICGKGIQFGHNVSHANNKTQKIWFPNLQRIRVLLTNGGTKRMKVCTRCIRGNKVQKPIKKSLSPTTQQNAL